MAQRNPLVRHFIGFFREERPRVWHYISSLLLILVAVALKQLISYYFASDRPYLLLFSAVAISGLIGGMRVGIFATIISAFCGLYFFVAPQYSIFIRDSAEFFHLSLFVIDGLVISLINGALRSAYLSAQKATEMEVRSSRALRQSEALMQKVFDANVIGLMFTSFDGRVIDANQAMLDMIGYTREELTRGLIRWDQLTPPEQQWVNEKAVRELKEKGVCQKIEKDYIRKDGTRIPVLMGSSRIDDHPLADAITFVIDITDRKKVEQELAVTNEQLELRIEKRTKELVEANSFLDSLIENIPNMIFVKDAKDLRFLRFNKAGEDLLGMKRNQLIGKNDYDFFPKEEADYFTAKDRDVLSGRVLVDIPEEPLTTAQGVRLLHTKKIPIVSTDGTARYLLGISEDITEWKRAERERLQFAEEQAGRRHAERLADRLRILSEASAILGSSFNSQLVLDNLTKLAVPRIADWCLVHMVQNDGKIKMISAASRDPERAKWALENQKTIPSDGAPEITELTLRSGKSQLVASVTEEMLVNASENAEQIEIYRSFGIKSYIGASIRGRNQAFGVLTLLTTTESGRTYTNDDLHLAEDLAERIGFAVENAQLYQEATSVNRMKDEFLATLSHELRTPLNVIQGHADILKVEGRDMKPEDLMSSIDAIQRNARAQTQIVQDILDVSAIVTGKVSVHATATSVTEILRSAMDGLLIPARKKNIGIIAEYPLPDVCIYADPLRMQQVIWNLLSNAIKFTPEGGKISIHAKANGRFCEISVKDTGKGIAAEFLPHVFERFRQEDSALSRRYGGLGLGLSIVKHLVELHQGRVTVRSAGVGKGTTFTVEIPLADACQIEKPQNHDERTAAKPKAENSQTLSGYRILVIDDEADNRALVKRFLEKAGAKVTTVASGQEALTVLNDQAFDFIASDISMPEMDGFEFIERYREIERQKGKPATPAAALTAYTREEERKRAISSGFQSHIAKPVTAKSLVESIQQTLNMDRAEA